jgi:predicted nucleotidyltransferase
MPGRPPALTEPVHFDVERLLRALDAHGVEFVVVGGVAAGIHGATRATEDLDLVARRTKENLDRLAAAMRELGARLRIAGLDDSEAEQLPVRLVGATLAQMELSTWRTKAGDFDVLVGIPDRHGRVVPYEELVNRAVAQRLHGVELRTAALDDIIASKEWADRPKDRDALPELRALRDGRR